MEIDKDIKGIELSEGFYIDAVKPIIDKHFSELEYTAGIFGYGSDVLGYDDEVSRDHMWGPRLYILVRPDDMEYKEAIMEKLQAELPYVYKGHSVNFSEPDINDGGVQHAEIISDGKVNPLIWIESMGFFINEYLGFVPVKNEDWLSVSEHRLLGITSGKVFRDDLGFEKTRERLAFYPKDVQLYLLASQWSLISMEQAFPKRAASRDDFLGAKIIALRIAERLMRICFLLKGKYAPYSKWFSYAFERLEIPSEIKAELSNVERASEASALESSLVKAQALVAELQNQSGLTAKLIVEEQSYFSRDIKVLFVDKFAEITQDGITDKALLQLPLIGSLSQIGNLTAIFDNPHYFSRIREFYEALEE